MAKGLFGKGIIIREAHFPGRAAIEAYGNGGFRFADMSHRGSLLCLPSGIHGWQPADATALSVADFDKVLAEAGCQPWMPEGRQSSEPRCDMSAKRKPPLP